ncbi:MAG: hypothetical protein ABWY94_04660 [Pseudoxanthomonas sp.]
MSKLEKTERMDKRRDIGNRKASVPGAPCPAPPYLLAHACFACRKSFKVAPRPDHVAVCPSCAGQLCEMGRSFKAPPMRDTEQWAKVRALYEAGFRFFSYRSNSAPPLPGRLSEVEAFVRDNPLHPLRVATSSK